MTRRIAITGLTVCACSAAFGQSIAALPQFDVAQLKPSKSAAGRVGGDRVIIGPGGFTGTGVTLKRLIFEAYDLPYYRIFGGPAWVDSEEYDVEAKAGSRASRDQLRAMLQTLLTDRFKLTLHRENKELRVYALTVTKDGPKLHPLREGERSSNPQLIDGIRHFRCDLTEFANLLSLQLNMPLIDDPSTPARSSGVPIPVLDNTGVKGIYDIGVDVKTDPSGDTFIAWQRALQEQLGLKLEAKKAPVEVLVIDRAEKVVAQN